MPFVEDLAGDVGLAGAAAFLALLCFGVAYLLAAIGKGIEATHIPLVSSGLASIWRNLTAPVQGWLTGWGASLFRYAEGWLRAGAFLAVGLFDDVIAAVVRQADNIAHLYNEVFPQGVSHAVSQATGYINQEIHAIRGDIADATTTIEKAATADAARALAKAEGFAGTIKSSLTRIVAHDLTVAETYTDTAVAGVKDWAEGAIGAIHIPDISGLEASVAGLIGTVAGVGIAVQAITSEFESCAVTTCDGPNNLSGLLNTLLGFGALADFAAFLESAITDPGGEATTVGAYLQGAVARFVTGGGDVWGAIESVLDI